MKIRLGRYQPILEIADLSGTQIFPAGAVAIGVEPRSVVGGPVDPTIFPEAEVGATFNDGGASIHVFDGEVNQIEFLRFDCFAANPHYHYIWPDGNPEISEEKDVSAADNSPNLVATDNMVVMYDQFAHGDDMIAWTLECLRHRLTQMLAHSGGSALINKLEPERVRAVLDSVGIAARGV